MIRVAVFVFTLFIVGNLIVISISWLQESRSPRHVGVLVVLWVLGILALTILMRGYGTGRRISEP